MPHSFKFVKNHTMASLRTESSPFSCPPANVHKHSGFHVKKKTAISGYKVKVLVETRIFFKSAPNPISCPSKFFDCAQLSARAASPTAPSSGTETPWRCSPAGSGDSDCTFSPAPRRRAAPSGRPAAAYLEPDSASSFWRTHSSMTAICWRTCSSVTPSGAPAVRWACSRS